MCVFGWVVERVWVTNEDKMDIRKGPVTFRVNYARGLRWIKGVEMVGRASEGGHRQ